MLYWIIQMRSDGERVAVEIDIRPAQRCGFLNPAPGVCQKLRQVRSRLRLSLVIGTTVGSADRFNEFPELVARRDLNRFRDDLAPFDVLGRAGPKGSRRVKCFLVFSISDRPPASRGDTG